MKSIAIGFTIFNRYGQRGLKLQIIGTGWDATFKGVTQPKNEYVYPVRYKNINGELSEYKDIVTLAS